MKFHAFILLVSISFCTGCISQTGKSSFYPEGYGRLLSREHVNFLSINTENTVDSFFNTLKQKLDSPKFSDGYIVFYCTKPQWSKEKVVIRIQQALQTDLDKKTSNTLFIFAETKREKDLLKPKTKSYRQIKDFFKSLYDKTIVNAPVDSSNHN
jgi:hypothetical protein